MAEKGQISPQWHNLGQKIGLPVPAGFTITTEVCTYFYAHGNQYPPELEAQVNEAMAAIEKTMGKKFGDTKDLPLRCPRVHARYDGHRSQYRSQ